MLLYIGKQFIRMLLLLLCVSIVAFILVSISPINPLQANVGQTALGSISREQRAKLETYWGVGQPPVNRYLAWAKDFLRGDMGVSLLYRQPVAQVISQRLVNSLWLLALAWLISGLAGFGLGVLAGANRGSLTDKLVKGYSLLMASTPAFWLALVLLMIFAVWLQWLPVGFSAPIGMGAAEVTLADRLRHAVLPALTLSLLGMSGITLHTREKMADVMQSDYVLFVLARGESKSSIVRRHGLRNIMLPALTIQFGSIGEIFGGSVLVEQVFSYPGLGQDAINAGLGGDVPLLMAIAVISAVIVFLGNFIANALYGIIDPRIRRGGI